MKRRNKGQNLLEFALVAPILILVLVVISELGYTFVVRHTIIDSIKQTVASSQFNVGKFTSTEQMLSTMKTELEAFIDTHNLPTPEDITFGVAGENAYGTAVIISYSYRPGFRLVGITPEVITVQSVQVVQPALLKINNPTVPFVPSL
jgi:hypothetical protein